MLYLESVQKHCAQTSQALSNDAFKKHRSGRAWCPRYILDENLINEMKRIRPEACFFLEPVWKDRLTVAVDSFIGTYLTEVAQCFESSYLWNQEHEGFQLVGACMCLVFMSCSEYTASSACQQQQRCIQHCILLFSTQTRIQIPRLSLHHQNLACFWHLLKFEILI